MSCIIYATVTKLFSFLSRKPSIVICFSEDMLSLISHFVFTFCNDFSWCLSYFLFTKIFKSTNNVGFVPVKNINNHKISCFLTSIGSLCQTSIHKKANIFWFILLKDLNNIDHILPSDYVRDIILLSCVRRNFNNALSKLVQLRMGLCISRTMAGN